MFFFFLMGDEYDQLDMMGVWIEYTPKLLF